MHDLEIYIYHQGHEYDRIFTENLQVYFAKSGLRSHALESNNQTSEADLSACLKNSRAVVIGYNAQLDHLYIEGKSFVIEAARRRIPIIQWILDHPAARWPEFDRALVLYSAFLLNTEQERQYFLRFCHPGAIARVMGGVGPSPRSRVARLSREEFCARRGRCLIALGFKRLGRTIAETRAEIE